MIISELGMFILFALSFLINHWTDIFWFSPNNVKDSMSACPSVCLSCPGGRCFNRIIERKLIVYVQICLSMIYIYIAIYNSASAASYTGIWFICNEIELFSELKDRR